MPPTVAETALPLKVAEALANALPVVASSGAVGGTSLVSGVHALVADDAESAATALVALLDDDAYRLRVGRAGHRWALENLAPGSIAARLATESVLVTRP
jgi:glycosyltransferase involved in cell wall biosynthesis